MNRRILSLLAAAVLLLTACLSACAETRIVYRADASVDVSFKSDTITVYRNRAYFLAAPDGTPLSGEYDYISENSEYGLFTVKALESADGLHREGVMDAQGTLLIPAVYADVDIISERWQLGIRLKESTEESTDYSVSDYSTGKKTFYLIDAVDVFYRGKQVGTVTRSDYRSAYAHGDYICFRGRSEVSSYAWYDKQLQPSAYAAESSSEYDSRYKSGTTTYWHQGSGQQAFCGSCTLTPDEVEACYMTEKGKVYDLQGNEVCTLKADYDSIRSLLSSRWATVRLNGKYGVVDVLTGEEIIPLEYDRINSYTVDDVTGVGYACAVKDGKIGFVRNDGTVTCDFVYAESAARDYGLFAYVKDLTGGVIVLSAQAGILPDHYADVSVRTGARAFTAENDQGQNAVIGLNGQALVPFGGWRYAYVNQDATLACAREEETREYCVWSMDYADAAAAVETDAQTPPAAQPEDETWTCSNGHAGNTGKFCPECGEPRPQVPENVICPGCGTEYPAGEAPKFCPECGTKL